MVEAAAADWRNRRRECDGIAFVMGYEDEMGQRGVSRRIEDRKAPLHAGTPFEHGSLLRQDLRLRRLSPEHNPRMPRINGALTRSLARKSRCWPVLHEELSGPAHT